MAILLKLTDGRFLEYSTISDSPNTLSMSEAELRVWYRDEYGRKAYEHEFEERLNRTKANGHSGRGKETAESAIICDRSGPDETPLALEQITEKYRPASNDGMTFSQVIAAHFARGGMKTFSRASEPHIHYDFDAAEGLRFWSMNHETDDLSEHAFNAEQVVAQDWTIDP